MTDAFLARTAQQEAAFAQNVPLACTVGWTIPRLPPHIAANARQGSTKMKGGEQPAKHVPQASLVRAVQQVIAALVIVPEARGAL